MRFPSTILYLLLIILSCQTLALNAQDNGKKKKKKKGDDKTETGSLDKSSQQKLSRLFLEAEKAKVTEDWETAIKNYQEVVATDPNNANAHFQLSQIFYNQGKMAESESEALSAVKTDGNNKWYYEMLANIYMNEGKPKEAVEIFKELIRKFPNSAEYYLNLGFLQSKLGQYETAVKTYEQFEKNFGIDENVIMEKKNLFLRLNKFNEAIAEVEKLVDAFPEDVDYLHMEAELYRANRMKEKATELYKKILTIEPDNADALLAMADMGMQSGDTKQSLESIKKIFENPKVDVDTKIKILYPYLQYWELQKDKKQDAIDLAELLTATHPDDAKGFAIKGDLYYLDLQNDKALESYKRGLELNKDVFQVWQQVMVIYNLKRDWAALQKTSNEAMELFPNQAMVYLFKGTAEQQNKELEKAVKSYLKGEKMTADNDKLRGQFWANLGDAYHSLNKMTESDSAYDRSLKLDPENAYVLNNYSYYLSLRKANLEKAKQMSAYANKLDPDNSSFLDTYAWILFQLNDFTGAKEWQEKAMKADDGQSGTILEHYGDIIFKLGSTEEAVKFWKQAKEKGTDSISIDKKIAQGKYIE
ncbi:MAG: tetratricopeptide repeat protein [Chitinophagales bacterium]